VKYLSSVLWSNRPIIKLIFIEVRVDETDDQNNAAFCSCCAGQWHGLRADSYGLSKDAFIFAAAYFRCYLIKSKLCHSFFIRYLFIIVHEKSKIELCFLPPYSPYSPNLNLIERYWKYFKKTLLYNRYYETFAEFKKDISSHQIQYGDH